jgi:hypothetical protein
VPKPIATALSKNTFTEPIIKPFLQDFNMPSDLVIVKSSDLAAVVAQHWEATKADYMTKCPRLAWFTKVHTFDDNHIFHRLIALAVACGFVTNEQQVWDDMREKMGINAFDEE